MDYELLTLGRKQRCGGDDYYFHVVSSKPIARAARRSTMPALPMCNGIARVLYRTKLPLCND